MAAAQAAPLWRVQRMGPVALHQMGGAVTGQRLGQEQVLDVGRLRPLGDDAGPQQQVQAAGWTLLPWRRIFHFAAQQHAAAQAAEYRVGPPRAGREVGGLAGREPGLVHH